MRIQFTVNANELAKIQNLAQKAGYPDVSSYCRDDCIRRKNHMQKCGKQSQIKY